MQYTVLTAWDNKGLCFLRLNLGINFLDLLRAVSFALSFGMPLASMHLFNTAGNITVDPS